MLRCLFVTGPELNPGWSPFLKPVLPTQGEAERGNPGEGGPSRQAPGLALSSKQGAEIIAKDTCLHPNDGTNGIFCCWAGLKESSWGAGGQSEDVGRS